MVRGSGWQIALDDIIQRYSSSRWPGFEDENYGSSPGRLAAAVAYYCASRWAPGWVNSINAVAYHFHSIHVTWSTDLSQSL